MFIFIWLNKYNLVYEYELLYGYFCSFGILLSYNDLNIIFFFFIKKVMKLVIFNRFRFCINFEIFFYVVILILGIYIRNVCI